VRFRNASPRNESRELRPEGHSEIRLYSHMPSPWKSDLPHQCRGSSEVEHLSEEQGVTGSTPVLGTIRKEIDMKNPCLTCKTPYPPSFPDEGYTCAYQEDSAIGDACPLYERYKASQVQISEYRGPHPGICGLGYEHIREGFMKKQLELCNAKGWPFFMPSDGVCGHCHQNLIDREIMRGNDGSTLVTGCSSCGRSYCD
jgi:hypothetical protein